MVPFCNVLRVASAFPVNISCPLHWDRLWRGPAHVEWVRHKRHGRVGHERSSSGNVRLTKSSVTWRCSWRKVPFVVIDSRLTPWCRSKRPEPSVFKNWIFLLPQKPRLGPSSFFSIFFFSYFYGSESLFFEIKKVDKNTNPNCLGIAFSPKELQTRSEHGYLTSGSTISFKSHLLDTLAQLDTSLDS